MIPSVSSIFSRADEEIRRVDGIFSDDSLWRAAASIIDHNRRNCEAA
jgi:hypothetical protein